MTRNKKLYAVTGGIGSGKSAVCSIIAQENYPVVSCDEVYAQLTRGGNMVKKLEDAFGGVTLPDGSLDRHALSKRVFGDKTALGKLNGITHGEIMRELFRQAEEAEGNIVFCEVPLLFENRFEKNFDGVLVVTRPLEQRIAAVMERNGLSRDEVTARIAAQYDYDGNSFTQYYVLCNDGNLQELYKKVKKILQKINKLT